MDNKVGQDSKLKEFLAELSERLADPIHKRLIQTYKKDEPTEAMEKELGQVLLEVLQR